jgi:BlaI family penicillinase repressor
MSIIDGPEPSATVAVVQNRDLRERSRRGLGQKKLLRDNHVCSRLANVSSPLPKLTKLELHIMEALWTLGPCSVREIQEAFPLKKRPAYTTVQTTVYRLEVKKALRRVKKISTALIFEASVSREAAERRLIDDLLGLFGGRSRPIVAHLIESGSLTLEDIREAEKVLLEKAE